jgi:general secretion pathway protein D
MNLFHYALVALAAAASPWSCAQATKPIQPGSVAASTQHGKADAIPIAEETKPRAEPRFIRGNDRVIAPAVVTPALSGAPSAFNFEETPVTDVVRIVLGDILKVDYVLYPPIGGTVTLATREAISPDQAVYLLESALHANGLVLVRDARGTYHVGRPDAVKGVGANLRQVSVGGSLPPGYGAIIVPLQFIGANEMATILRPLMPAEALVRVDALRNLLVLVGTRSQADGWLDMVRTFDVDLLKGMSVGVFPLKYASVKEVEAALRLMAPAGAAAAALPAPGARPPTGAGATPTAITSANTTSLSDANPLHGALRIMPIERLNSILVVTPRVAYLEEAKRWIERFDQPDDNAADAQLFVYPVQNGSSKHLAEVLAGIFGGGGGSSSAGASTTPGTGVAPRLPTSSASAAGLQQNVAQPAVRANQNQVSSVTTLDQSGVRIVADERNNAVLIYGARKEYNRIEAALKRLDMPATQVLIEASIIEVTLKDELKYGVQWMFTGAAGDGLRGAGVLSDIAGGVLGEQAKGFSYTLSKLSGARAVINALAGKTNLNVIASPSLMVLDNHTANISSGDQVPVNIGSTVGLGGVLTPNFQYKDTGVVLAVTPSVNAGDMVTMEINQSVIDILASNTGNSGQPTFLQRQVSSKVAVRSGETIVLGGLIRDKVSASDSGVPGLHAIPLFGALFGTKEKNLDRTELLVVITPRVIRSDQGLREASQELRERMRGLRIDSSGFGGGSTHGP